MEADLSGLLFLGRTLSIGPDSALSSEDADALASVLPGSQLFDSDFGFFLHTASLFKAAFLTEHEVHFSRLALTVAPEDWETIDLWYSIIKGSIDLGYYDDAYAALMATPHQRLYADLPSMLWRCFVN